MVMIMSVTSLTPRVMVISMISLIPRGYGFDYGYGFGSTVFLILVLLLALLLGIIIRIFGVLVIQLSNMLSQNGGFIAVCHIFAFWRIILGLIILVVFARLLMLERIQLSDSLGSLRG
ncbi:hypothetical protein BDFG_04378 [Blastomyces dermatitidis ATCC 26199]|nr:hypothetical protein BDFG_04378 [Blastomyces dermatitidis ATCC 26199]